MTKPRSDAPVNLNDLRSDYRWMLDQSNPDRESRLIDEGADLTVHCMRTGNGAYLSPLPLMCDRESEDSSDDGVNEISFEEFERTRPFVAEDETLDESAIVADPFDADSIIERAADGIISLSELVDEVAAARHNRTLEEAIRQRAYADYLSDDLQFDESEEFAEHGEPEDYSPLRIVPLAPLPDEDFTILSSADELDDELAESDVQVDMDHAYDDSAAVQQIGVRRGAPLFKGRYTKHDVNNKPSSKSQKRKPFATRQSIRRAS